MSKPIIEIRGDLVNAAEIRAKLATLEKKIIKPLVTKALKAGTKIVHAEAVRRAPVGGRKWQTKKGKDKVGGLLKASLKVYAKKRSRTAIGWQVETSSRRFAQVGGIMKTVNVFYGPFVEFGHKIGKRLSGKDMGEQLKQVKGEKRAAYLERIASGQSRVKAYNESRADVPGLHFMEEAGKSKADEASAKVVSELRAGLQARSLL